VSFGCVGEAWASNRLAVQEESRVSSLEEQLAAAKAEVTEERRGRQQAASTIADLKGQLVAANQTHVHSPASNIVIVISNDHSLAFNRGSRAC